MAASVMTDYQYRSILKSIRMIVKNCGSVDEVLTNIDELLDEDKPKNSNRKKKKDEDK